MYIFAGHSVGQHKLASLKEVSSFQGEFCTHLGTIDSVLIKARYPHFWGVLSTVHCVVLWSAYGCIYVHVCDDVLR